MVAPQVTKSAISDTKAKMQLLRIHYQKLFVCVMFLMVVLVVMRVWDDDEDLTHHHSHHTSAASSSRLQGERLVVMKGDGGGGGSVRENSINIDAPVLKPGGVRKESGTKILTDLFQEIVKVPAVIPVVKN